MSTRELGPWGFGQRTTLEVRGQDRLARGLQNSGLAEFMGVRERWAQLVNEALRDAGLDARVDARSLAAQGIDREPGPTIPEAVKYLERCRGPSAAGDAIRRRYEERVAARQQSPEELARVLERQNQEKRDYFIAKAAHPPEAGRSRMTPEERKAKRRERDLARREIEKQERAMSAERVQQKNKKVVAIRVREKCVRNPEQVRFQKREYLARTKAEARRKKWAVLEAARVAELRRLEQVKKPMPTDAGLERSSAVLERSGVCSATRNENLMDGKSQERTAGLDLEI